jgi:hypothetical protein
MQPIPLVVVNLCRECPTDVFTLVAHTEHHRAQANDGAECAAGKALDLDFCP